MKLGLLGAMMVTVGAAMTARKAEKTFRINQDVQTQLNECLGEQRDRYSYMAENDKLVLIKNDGNKFDLFGDDEKLADCVCKGNHTTAVRFANSRGAFDDHDRHLSTMNKMEEDNSLIKTIESRGVDQDNDGDKNDNGKAAIAYYMGLFEDSKDCPGTPEDEVQVSDESCHNSNNTKYKSGDANNKMSNKLLIATLPHHNCEGGNELAVIVNGGNSICINRPIYSFVGAIKQEFFTLLFQ